MQELIAKSAVQIVELLQAGEITTTDTLDTLQARIDQDSAM